VFEDLAFVVVLLNLRLLTLANAAEELPDKEGVGVARTGRPGHRVGLHHQWPL
jgi:hypothetical protein